MNTKLLRQKILDLAIRGKLTEQLKSDGTTKDLLASIAASSDVILSEAIKNGRQLVALPFLGSKEQNPEQFKVTERSRSTLKSSDVIASVAKQSKKNSPAASKNIIPLDKATASFEIPENWEWVRLGNLCSKFSTGPFGTMLHQSDYVQQDGIPLINPTNIRNGAVDASSIKMVSKNKVGKLNTFVLVEGDVILARRGDLSKCAEITRKENGWLAGTGAFFLHSNWIENKYLLAYYLTNGVQSYLVADSRGSTMDNLNQKLLYDLPIPLPPLAEQQRIVSAIETAFAEITEIEKNQELLKKHIKLGRQKILDLAIRGKLTQQLKTDGTTKDLLDVIASAAKQSKKNPPAASKNIIPLDKATAPFEIPANWEWVKIDDIALDMADGPFGSNLKAEHYTDKKEARIIQLSNIAENGWRDENVRYTTFEHARNNVFRSVVEPGNLVIAKMMPAGRTMICPSTEKMYVLSSDAVKLVPNDTLIDRQFLCYLMNSPSFREQINDNIQGTTRLRTSISKLRDCILALPPLAEQQRIVTAIEQSFAEFDAMERNIT